MNWLYIVLGSFFLLYLIVATSCSPPPPEPTSTKTTATVSKGSSATSTPVATVTVTASKGSSATSSPVETGETCSSPKEQAYFLIIAAITSGIANDWGSLTRLLLGNDFTDAQWRSDMKSVLSDLSGRADDIDSISAPSSLSSLHEDMLLLSIQLRQIAILLDRSIDNRDIDAIDEAGLLMKDMDPLLSSILRKTSELCSDSGSNSSEPSVPISPKRDVDINIEGSASFENRVRKSIAALKLHDASARLILDAKKFTVIEDDAPCAPPVSTACAFPRTSRIHIQDLQDELYMRIVLIHEITHLTLGSDECWAQGAMINYMRSTDEYSRDAVQGVVDTTLGLGCYVSPDPRSSRSGVVDSGAVHITIVGSELFENRVRKSIAALKLHDASARLILDAKKFTVIEDDAPCASPVSTACAFPRTSRIHIQDLQDELYMRIVLIHEITHLTLGSDECWAQGAMINYMRSTDEYSRDAVQGVVDTTLDLGCYVSPDPRSSRSGVVDSGAVHITIVGSELFENRVKKSIEALKRHSYSSRILTEAKEVTIKEDPAPCYPPASDGCSVIATNTIYIQNHQDETYFRIVLLHEIAHLARGEGECEPMAAMIYYMRSSPEYTADYIQKWVYTYDSLGCDGL